MADRGFYPLFEKEAGRCIVRGVGYLQSEYDRDPAILTKVNKVASVMALVMDARLTGEFATIDIKDDGTTETEGAVCGFSSSMFNGEITVIFLEGPLFEESKAGRKYDFKKENGDE